LADAIILEAALMELGLGPADRGGAAILELDKGIDMLVELLDRVNDASALLPRPPRLG
jgi:hypothetical protein